MTTLQIRRVGRFLLAGCFLLLTLGTAGCDGGGGNGDLSGKVSYQGKPLAVGSILLIGGDAKPRTAPIEEDGSYHFANVPVGEAKLAVYSPDPAKQAKQRKSGRKNPLPKDAPELPAIERARWFTIPAEYSDVDHSRLRVTIQRGPNTYHIEMK